MGSCVRPVSTQWGQRLSWVVRKILVSVAGGLAFLGGAVLLQAEKQQ